MYILCLHVINIVFLVFVHLFSVKEKNKHINYATEIDRVQALVRIVGALYFTRVHEA